MGPNPGNDWGNLYIHVFGWGLVFSKGISSALRFVIMRFSLLDQPLRIIQTINALPSSSNPQPNDVMLQIENVPMLPGRTPPSMVVSAKDVSLSSSLIKVNEASKRENAEIRRRQDEMNQRNKSGILARPFRQIGFFTWRAFRGVRTIFDTEAFIRMRVKGRNGTWKLSQGAAWALDNGKAIDKLVKHNK